MKRQLSKIFFVAAVLAICTPLTFADTPGHHPGYLHALTDLRYARSLLQMDYGNDWPALREVDAAIREAKEAAINDGKPLNDHPHEDASLDRRGRLHKALSLLDSAERDMTKEEDNPSAIGWRDRAIHHVVEARRMINSEIR